MMDPSFGPQYALSVAVQTLKERCFQLQNRIRSLERENVTLRGNKCDCNDHSNLNGTTETQILRHQVLELTEKKEQLTSDITMVTMENRKLWSRLSKLLEANKALGTKLNHVDEAKGDGDCIQGSRSPLIRSRTFTQDEAQAKKVSHKNVADDCADERLSAELEDVSLQLMSALAKEKHELNYQLIELSELQNDENNTTATTTFLTSSISAYLPNDLDYSVDDDLDQHLKALGDFQSELVAQKRKIEECMANFLTMKAGISESQRNNKTTTTTSISIQTSEEQMNAVQLANNEKICPVCSQQFPDSCDLDEFSKHVTNHFDNST